MERSVGGLHLLVVRPEQLCLCQGRAIAISSQLKSAVIGVAHIDECMMLVRLKHTLGFSSYCSVHHYQDVRT